MRLYRIGNLATKLVIQIVEAEVAIRRLVLSVQD